jgi:RecA-family ATPase
MAKNTPGLKMITARALQKKKFAPVNHFVEGIIIEGLTLLGGKPKVGKSRMAADIALACATGGKALTDIQCEKMTVIYCALEDNERRLKATLAQFMGKNNDWPSGLKIVTDMRRLDLGGIDDLRASIEEHEAELVIIDVLQKVRAPRKRNEDPYAADYAAMSGLHKLAKEKRIAVLVVHHLRKGEADDPMDMLSGTLGLTAVPDTLLVLKRADGGVTLHGRSRDLKDEIELAMELNRLNGRWKILGKVDEVRRSDERKEILRVLHEADEPMTPTAIAQAIGKPNVNVRVLLLRMGRAGEVRKTKRGMYVYA